MKSNAYLAILSAVALSLISTAQANEKRWFEMEVILFNQLGDKNQLKENFSDTPPMPTYRRVRDLLSDYLTPDIRQLKKHLPICEQSLTDKKSPLTFKHTELNPVPQKPALPSVFPIKTADDLQTEMLIEHPELNSAYYQVPNQAQNTAAVNDLDLVDSLNNSHELSETAELLIRSPEQLAKQQAELAKQRAVLAAAEHEFSVPPYQFTPIDFTDKLCRLSSDALQVLKAADPTFDANAFEINKVPRTIDAVETPFSDQPYLISADSLELHDIVKQLSLSRDFRPLLHIGWRQSEPAINQKRSIPMRLFAGDNLAAHYQKQLAQYKAELAQAKAEESKLQTLLMNSSAENNTDLLNNEESKRLAKQLHKQNKLKEIIANLKQVPTDKATLLANIDAIEQSIQANKQALAIKPPIKPEQDWSVEGLFNVHLNHYLYITADLNIANMSLAEQASKSLAKGEPQAIKSIRFSQNKRVISKEIHYFDHPYIGMIVQIRRHYRPDPLSLKNAPDN